VKVREKQILPARDWFFIATQEIRSNPGLRVPRWWKTRLKGISKQALKRGCKF